MKRSILACICTFLLFPTVSFADNNTRDYVAAPPDTLLSMLYYNHIDGDTLNVDGDKAADVDLSQELFLLREVYYFQAGSLLANAQMILPFGNASLDVPGSYQSSSGIGDLMLLGTIWFVNNPTTNTYFAFSPYFFLPTGEYDENQTLNMGSNRYAFREEFNFTKGFEIIPDHKLYLETTVGCDFYMDNDEYNGNQELSQDPLFNLEGHVSYDITKELALSLDYYGHWGGSTEVDGQEVDDSEVTSHTLGTTLTYAFAPGWQFLLQYKEDIENENGIEAEVIQARIFYALDLGNLL